MRLCVHWPRFGPYHLARLRAAQAHFQGRGGEVVGLETAGYDATYAWAQEDDAEATFGWERVFPDRTFEAIPVSEVQRGVTAALDRIRPDAVAINSYSFADAQACLLWCRRHRRPAIVMSDSKADDGPRSAWRERLKAAVVGQFDAAVVAGTPQRRYIERLGIPPECISEPYDVVDNGFFEAGAASARQDPAVWASLPGLADPAPYFLACSRFLAVKNLPLLLRAYAAYRAETSAPWRLLLVGDGPERSHLEATVAAAQIEGVVLCGFQQRDILPAYYGLAGAFVHPAWKDTWGLVVNEAMAAGLPVLVSDRAGCAQDLVAEGENGFTFAPHDERRLAHLLARTASASDAEREAMGARSRTRIAAYSPERFAGALATAVEAGRSRADRPPGLILRALLWAGRRARDSRAFHAIPH